MLACEYRKHCCSSTGEALPQPKIATEVAHLLDGSEDSSWQAVVSPIDLGTAEGLKKVMKVVVPDMLLQLETTLASNQAEVRTCLQHMQDELAEISRVVKGYKPVGMRTLSSSNFRLDSGTRNSLGSDPCTALNTDPLSPKNKSPKSAMYESNGNGNNALLKVPVFRSVSSRISVKTKATLNPFVKNVYFDWFWGLMIILNSILMGVEAEYSARTQPLDPSVKDNFAIAQWVFAALFTIELFLRVGAVGASSFFVGGDSNLKNKEISWNLFDTAMVCVSVVEGALPLFQVDESSSSEAGTTFRLVRMARLTRIVRVLRFCAPLRLMFFMIFECLKSLGWFVVIIAVMLYVLGICFTQAATEYLHEGVHQKYAERVEEYFGGLDKSIYTLYKAMTSGQSWGEFSEVLFDMNAFIVVVWFSYISFAILCLLNVITGVFVDGALAKSQHDRDIVVEKEMSMKKAIVDNLREVFEETDADNSGHISYDEFVENVEKDDRVRAYLSALGVEMHNTQDLFKLLDMDNDGNISVEEFVESCLHLKGQASAHDVQRVLLESKKTGNRLQKISHFTDYRFDAIEKLIHTAMDTIRDVSSTRRQADSLPPPRSAVNLGDAPNGLNRA